MRKYIIYILLPVVIAIVGCSEDPYTSVIDGIVLKDSIPERVFYFSYDYIGLRQGTEQDMSQVSFPTPYSRTSYSSFTATSRVRVEDGIRYIDCELKQGLHAMEDSVDAVGGPIWVDQHTLNLRLNIAPEGDVTFGTLYSKEEVLSFLQVDKTYGTDVDAIGDIAVQGNWRWLVGDRPEDGQFALNSDTYGPIGIQDYSITVTEIVDYQDFTRTGELIKDALKVTVSIDGTLGVSASVPGDPTLEIDQLQVENATVVFLVDYR